MAKSYLCFSKASQNLFVVFAISFMLCEVYWLSHKNYLKSQQDEKMSNRIQTDLDRRGYDNFTATRFAKRYERMYKNCKQNPPKFAPIPDILVSEKFKLEVCVIPKAGSSAWNHMFYALQSYPKIPPNISSQAIWSLVRKSSYAIKNKIPFDNWTLGIDDDFFTEPNPQHIYRIITGRHPFARLISAWNQKFWTAFQPRNHFYNSYRAQLRYYTRVEPDEFHVISWEDFARYISDIPQYRFKMDYHFRPVASLCRKCNYFYTYVIKLETLTEDYNWLKRRINLPEDIDLIPRNLGPSVKEVNEDPSAKIAEYMKRLPRDVVMKLYAIYKADFDDFGYTFNFETFEAGGFD